MGRPRKIKVDDPKEEEVIITNEEIITKEEVVEKKVSEPIVAKNPVAQELKQPTVEVMSVEGTNVRARVYPQIRVGICEFHGTPYGRVDMMTLKGKCFHQCATDPLCPHSKTGCPDGKPVIEMIDGEEVQTGTEPFCRHEHNYKGLALRCSYCPKDADMRSVIKSRTLSVFGHPENPSKLIIVCNDYRCAKKHIDRFSKQAI